MALTASEEALVRQLLDQQAAILSLAGNEATITSKLGATKVTLADLVAASSLADADLLLTRQGTTDKSVRADILATYMASELNLSQLAPIASPTFTGDPKAPTPAQFDNDTSLATTAFVQRALGSYAGSSNISAGGTIQQGDVGKVHVFGSTAARQVIYLPSLVGLPAGATIAIHGYGAFDYTIDPQGGQDILARGTVLTSLPMKGADSAVLYKESDTRWVLIGGTVQEAYSPRQASSLTTNGYQKLPSGLIVQWATISLAADTSSLLNFPIAFPTAALAIVGSRRADGSNASYNFSINSATQLRAQNTAGGTETAHYIAIGY